MIDKIGLYVCPEEGCPAIGAKPGSKCPKHNRELVRHIYVRKESPEGSSGDMGDLLQGLFQGAQRGGSSQQRRR